MDILIHRRVVTLSLLTFVTIFTIVFSSCEYLDMSLTLQAKRKGIGYLQGKPRVSELVLNILKLWTRQAIQNDKASKSLNIHTPYSSIIVSSDATVGNGGDFINAAELIQHEIDLNLNKEFPSPGFQIISQNNIQLGKVDGEDLVYSFRLQGLAVEAPAEKANIDKIVLQRITAADYKGRIYDIGIFVDADKYEAVKDGFEHILSTFKFLN